MGGKILERRDIGRKPGEAVRAALIALQERLGDTAVLAQSPSEPRARLAIEIFGDGGGRSGAAREVLHAQKLETSMTSSSVLRPGRGLETRTAMFPGRCSFFHIFICALGMSCQE